MGIAFYGTAAIAYDPAGLLASKEAYLEIAEFAWSEMEMGLRDVAIENEPASAKIQREFRNSRIC